MVATPKYVDVHPQKWNMFYLATLRVYSGPSSAKVFLEAPRGTKRKGSVKSPCLAMCGKMLYLWWNQWFYLKLWLDLQNLTRDIPTHRFSGSFQSLSFTMKFPSEILNHCMFPIIILYCCLLLRVGGIPAPLKKYESQLGWLFPNFPIYGKIGISNKSPTSSSYGLS